MNVEVFLTGTLLTEDDVKGRNAVVIDVLRTSSTIAAALHNGARAVVPAADMEEAGKIAANLDPESFVMGGERDGHKIDGYHLGNSPLEYSADIVRDKTIILNTTNGTGAISRCRDADLLIVGSFLNASRVTELLRNLNKDVVLVCAGSRKRISLEDTLCAGLILHQLWNGNRVDDASDTAHIAFAQYLHDKDRLRESLLHCNHGSRLAKMGAAADVAFCAEVDGLPIIPCYADNQIVSYENVLQD